MSILIKLIFGNPKIIQPIGNTPMATGALFESYVKG